MSGLFSLLTPLSALLVAAGLSACGPDKAPGASAAGSGGPPQAGQLAAGQGLAQTAGPASAAGLPGKGAAYASTSFRFPAAPAAPAAATQPGAAPVAAEPGRTVLKLAAPPASPLGLTASDGSGLRLVALKASGVVEEPLALTELQLTFENPRDRVIEGQFHITLPQGATVSRFAMRQGDRWQEGEVVERQAARQAYEDFLHRRQDPALLEQQAGNEFSARVFPIPARGTKELIVSYSQELVKDEEPYRIHLLGLPELGSLQIRVLLGKSPADKQAAGSSLGGALLTHQVIEVSKQQWVPDRDFEVAQVHAADRLGLRKDNLVVARVTPILQPQPEEISSLYILLDTSASRALGYRQQVELVLALIDGLRNGAGPDTPLGLAFFDQVLEPVFAGKAKDFGASEAQKLKDRRPLGASNLQVALTALPALMNKDGVGRYRRVLLVTDGVATAGEVGGDRLLDAARSLRGAEVERLDVVAVGGIRDDETLRKLANAGLAHNGTVVDGTLPLPEIARKLTQAAHPAIRVNVEGAAWTWPVTLDGMQAGDQVLIYADLPAAAPFALSLDGVPVAADKRTLAEVARPLLERAWVQARISRVLWQRDTMAASDPDLREALRKQVIELSVKNRVLSPYTALLVLETEQDYARFGIDRNALADILTVGPEGVAVLNRSAASLLQGQPLQVATTTPPVLKSPPAANRPARMTSRAREGEMEEAGAKDKAADVDNGRRGGEGRMANAMGAAPGGPARAMAAPASGAAPSAPARLGRQAQEIFADEAEKKEAAKPYTMAFAGPRGAGGTTGAAAPRDDAPAMAEPTAAAPPPPPSPAPLPAQAPPAEPAPPAATDRLVASGESGGGAPAAQGILAQREERRAAVAEDVASRSALRLVARPAEEPRPVQAIAAPSQDQTSRVDPYTGAFKEVMDLLARDRTKDALARAWAWCVEAPGDVMALVALGEALEAGGDLTEAARAYGSLIDLFPSRADMRRFAGERLERLRGGAGLELAIDTLRKAQEQRPDHPASHRLLAFALLRASKPQEAFRVLVTGVSRQYPSGRFAGVDRILREDLGLAAAAWIKAAPAQREEVLNLLRTAGGSVEDGPSLRFVLNWETDANDVDFHIHDGQGGHAFYQSMHLPSGGDLYADVTTGYGPECFTIRNPAGQRAYPYRLQAHYYSRGPMGYGMGKLEVVEHDGKGGLSFEERPFVVMQDQAFVELGTIRQPLKIAGN